MSQEKGGYSVGKCHLTINPNEHS